MKEFFTIVRQPLKYIEDFQAREKSFFSISRSLWLIFILIAVCGSLLYGTSLSLVIPQFTLAEIGWKFTLVTGISWCIFGIILVAVTRKHPITCALAAMVTMVYGEAILLFGAVVNCAISLYLPSQLLIGFNALLLLLANIVMAISLSLQLQQIGVTLWKTLFLWMIVLNGCGLVFSWYLQLL